MNFECQQSDCSWACLSDGDFLLIFIIVIFYVRNVVFIWTAWLCVIFVFVYFLHKSTVMCTRQKWNNIVPVEYIRAHSCIIIRNLFNSFFYKLYMYVRTCMTISLFLLQFIYIFIDKSKSCCMIFQHISWS